MPNDWFQFRRFLVRQEKTAMKVGTDGVLLGAWAGKDRSCRPCRILDIGTGTGLVALMMAQRFPEAVIDAVEIDPDAGLQAEENFRSSIWNDRLHLHKISYQDFSIINNLQYDLIVSNPPYFSRSKQAPGQARNLARHDLQLPKEELVKNAAGQLKPDGHFTVILPLAIADDFMNLCSEQGLYLSRSTKIKPLPASVHKRILMEFGPERKIPEETEMVIELSRHRYSEEYKLLTEEFYLNML